MILILATANPFNFRSFLSLEIKDDLFVHTEGCLNLLFAHIDKLQRIRIRISDRIENIIKKRKQLYWKEKQEEDEAADSDDELMMMMMMELKQNNNKKERKESVARITLPSSPPK